MDHDEISEIMEDVFEKVKKLAIAENKDYQVNSSTKLKSGDIEFVDGNLIHFKINKDKEESGYINLHRDSESRTYKISQSTPDNNLDKLMEFNISDDPAIQVHVDTHVKIIALKIIKDELKNVQKELNIKQEQENKQKLKSRRRPK